MRIEVLELVIREVSLSVCMVERKLSRIQTYTNFTSRMFPGSFTSSLSIFQYQLDFLIAPLNAQEASTGRLKVPKKFGWHFRKTLTLLCELSYGVRPLGHI